MRRRSLRWTVVLVAAGLILSGCGNGLLGDRGGAASDDGPIRLGMLAPRTGSEAAIGPYMQNGAQLAIDEINAKGGVSGRKLELVVEDDACDPKTAVAGANKLIAAGVHLSVGGYCSGATLPTLPVFHRAGIPMIIPAANSYELVEQKLDNVFMINGTGDQQAAAAATWIGKQHATSVVVMHDNTSAPRDMAVRTQSRLASSGVKVTMETVNPKESDYSANVAGALRAKPDFIYWTGYFQEGGLIIRQLRHAGYHGAIMVGDGAVSAKLVEIAGASEAAGVFATMTQTPDTLPAAQGWVSAYKAKFGQDPGPYSNQSYDAVRLAAEAVRAAGGTDGKKIITALTKVDGFPMFSGPLRFTPEHTLSSGGFQILVVKDGGFTLADPLT
ncbi:branched-chain amino acid ABC transporter substrate-binding protein [Catellatospora tritici]|uniref:branched-chain amino acid ABC transporter substrate-binding protein n=1 Tax=Catellatospora tritici TaxID=2851566 RepID=UPI001C2CFEF2|nr:branched-chain amino acid ABC transporter substrate-binding protein [Catellatospora tritici]MBV1855009.1 branched-chain amino acid ABC transporter substrate-binding protein [Catellatospora tritici]